MGLERRGRAVHGQHEVNPVGVHPAGEEPRVRPEPKVKSFEIDKRLIYGAWEKVRANRWGAGCGRGQHRAVRGGGERITSTSCGIG